MASFCIRGLPEAARTLLRLQAAQNGHSMEAELRRILIDALLADRPRPGPAAAPAVDRPADAGYPDRSSPGAME